MEPAGNAGGAGAAAGGGTEAGGGGTAAADQSNLEFLAAPDSGGGAGDGQGAGAGGAGASPETRADASKAGAAAGDQAAPEVNLAALEEGQPEWLAKVTDEAARGEVAKLLDANKAFTARFKDAADLEAFFKDLPGGRDQVAAMQTLAKEVGELDGAIEGEAFDGHLSVADRVYQQAPQNAGSLMRAFAQTFAKNDAEGYNAIAGELVDATLRGAGIGLSFGELRQTIGEIKEAIAKQDADAWGRATAKLLGEPKAAAQVDPKLARAQEAERAARTAERGAKVQVWEGHVQKNGNAIEQHVRTSIGKALAVKDAQGRPLIPDSIPQKSREELTDRIMAEVDAQVGADRWLASQIFNLVGSRAGDKHNLGASEKEFGEALKLSQAAVDRVMGAAVKKVIAAWSRELVTQNEEMRQRARGAAAGAGAGNGIGAGGGGNGRARIMTETEAAEMDNMTLLNDPRGNLEPRARRR